MDACDFSLQLEGVFLHPHCVIFLAAPYVSSLPTGGGAGGTFLLPAGDRAMKSRNSIARESQERRK